MLEFGSASTSVVDTTKAVEDAIRTASAGRDPATCRLVVFHMTMGHDDAVVLKAVRRLCPGVARSAIKGQAWTSCRNFAPS